MEWHFRRIGYLSRLMGCALSLLSLLSPISLIANPTGAVVAAGAATIGSNGTTLNVATATNQTIINWSTFNIAGGETTHFLQPNSGSITLNRVAAGGGLSSLYGNLLSNGGIILINPNGILVGPGGLVNTESFTASTLDVRNQEFLRDHALHFKGDSTATVQNLGTITAQGGNIFLISQHIVNNGVLTAANGTVGLGAGTHVTLKQAGLQRLSVQVAPEGAPNGIGGIGIDNEGTIKSVTAELKANGNIYSLAVNNGGVIQATGSATVGGRVWLTGFGGAIRNTGTIQATNRNGKGGTIETSGKTVSLGGTILTGAGGQWLIDPLILDGSTNIAVATLAGQLNSGNVTETAATSITLNEALSWSGTGILTLTSGGTITLESAIAAPTGGLTLSALGNITSTAAVTIGAFTLNSGNWVQNNAALTTFQASSFILNEGNVISQIGSSFFIGNLALYNSRTITLTSVHSQSLTPPAVLSPSPAIFSPLLGGISKRNGVIGNDKTAGSPFVSGLSFYQGAIPDHAPNPIGSLIQNGTLAATSGVAYSDQ